jgi:hypothetical protein
MADHPILERAEIGVFVRVCRWVQTDDLHLVAP